MFGLAFPSLLALAIPGTFSLYTSSRPSCTCIFLDFAVSFDVFAFVLILGPFGATEFRRFLFYVSVHVLQSFFLLHSLPLCLPTCVPHMVCSHFIQLACPSTFRESSLPH